MSQTALPSQNADIDDAGAVECSADTTSDRPFPRIADKDGESSGFVSGLGGRRRNLRTCSAGSDFKVNATIPAKPARASISEGRGRSKSRGQQQATKALLGTSSDATVAELQQRLELMTREKVSLETALEHEQERIFNQSRRMSGASSPMPLVPAAGGAVSPRWARSHSRSSSVSSFGGASVGSVGITETLKADVNSLRLRLADAERELVSCYNQSQIYKKELVALRQRLGMRVDDLYLEDPVPSTIRTATDLAARPRRSQSVSSGASSTASTPSLIRRGSSHYHEYFSTIPATSVTTTTPRRVSQRPRSVLLSPRRSMEDHHLNAATPLASASAESASLFSAKSSAPLRTTRNVK
ncbi:hypothetical protein LPJ78_004578 [Coemansia sp. RSA 989]|nr:hypothetical protein BX667DRAFT_516622 [Coemansia mojavensis]KAJ1739894.1 hypothetical protein LPJ68_004273 [Coemansia sp. RSA 1086]KAJ1748494.1 hypothetical protein LPJ79_004485 [Coemansia sp. RSA 1821]KAJ1862660.1 hypothetical protein LPJ78_004578 [Coemansia sp. RSA 989]KAJ1870524.1 hypothetical protein LPJ55_004593 [Coemansia sp. RSA 990]KAJ2631115.1 hypothetical protein H4R22_002201 [Coemansia sp. RSA 1290]KAJ2649432.1 hypothetical protein IWW40_003103 [Coemansia sp. RSA 1250]KAJ26682